MSASAQIAGFAAGFAQRPLTAAQRHIAYRALLDTFAVAIAGRNEAATRLAERYMADLGAAGGASVWTTGAAASAEGAAWVNGVAAHVLDYDDVMTPMRAHVSATLVPALVALAQTHGADGGRFTAAYLAGFEVMAKFAKVMALPHYAKGWHSTSALGILGTTTACCVLLGLPAEQIVDALGLAVAQASGTRENFGAMAKSFQSAQCAAGAVRAALLAKSGFTASLDAIDGRYGFMALYADNEDLSPALDGLGGAQLEIDAIGIDVKKYPCCYALHRALDGMLALRVEHGLAADRIAQVQILTSAGGRDALITGYPQTGLQAKFSMEWAVACAIADGSIGFSNFTDQAVASPQMRSLMSRITVVEAPDPILPRWTEIRVELAGGGTLQRRVLSARGDAADPLGDDELIRKAQDCFDHGAADINAAAFAARLFAITDQPLGAVLEDAA